MKILAIETAAKPSSAALWEDGRLLALSYQHTGLTHSRTLMPMVEAMLKNAGAAVEEVDAVAAAVGPGSFTGVRIGVAAAKGIAWSLEKPCAGVSTLEAIAAGLGHLPGTICAAMDARRGQIYQASFRGGGELVRLCGDRAVDAGILAEEYQGLEHPVLLAGDGSALCAEVLEKAKIPFRLAPPHLRYQSAAGVAALAEKRLALGEGIPASELNPVYLRPPQAERERLEQREK